MAWCWIRTRCSSRSTQLSGVLPSQTQSMISTELNHLVSTSSGALGFGLIAGLLVALWSASRGMSGMITALTLAYGERETRSFLRFNLLALELTLGVIIGGLIVIALVAGLPAVVQAIGFGGFSNWLMLIVEWPLLMVVMMAGLAVLYRYAPNRDDPQWRWVSPGAIVATRAVAGWGPSPSASMSAISAATTRPTVRWAAPSC